MRLRQAAIWVLLVAVFIVTLAYGVQLPLLPALLKRQLVTQSDVAWHTGVLTGIYTFALFLFAPLWGWLSDRWQRRGIILIGLCGFALALGVLAFVDYLPALYAGRFLSGAFSAAVLPAAQALVADFSPDDHWRARRFAWLNIAGIAGFLVGPAIGGLLGNMWRANMPASGGPFLLIAAMAAITGLFAARLLPEDLESRAAREARRHIDSPRQQRLFLRLLLLLSALVAAGLGTFEVGLALIGGQELGLTPGRMGMMFAECMVAMAIAQALVFNPWFPPRATRWLLAPAFALFAAALFLLPLTRNTVELFWVVAVVAAAAGILTPVLGFWVSLTAGKAQGSELGWQIAASSAGQALGSAMAGMLYGTTWLTGGAFLLAGAGALVGAMVSLSLALQLGHSRTSRVNDSLQVGS